MPDLFNWGMTWLSDQMLTQASETVTYARDADTVELSAVVGATEQSIRRDFGMAGDVQFTEFIVNKAELILPNVGLALPIPGDQIIRTVDAVPITYQVSRGPNMAAWRSSDQYEDLIRIYTNRLDN